MNYRKLCKTLIAKIRDREKTIINLQFALDEHAKIVRKLEEENALLNSEINNLYYELEYSIGRQY